MGNSRRKGLISLTMLICLGAAIAGFSLSNKLWVSYAMLVLAGASMMAVFTSVNSLVQIIVTNEMRGRVMSVYTFAFRGGMPFGNLATGWLVKVFTAPIILAINGVLLVAVGLYYLLVERRVSEL
jgi:predicted MFS family arabinose efflux permease